MVLREHISSSWCTVYTAEVTAVAQTRVTCFLLQLLHAFRKRTHDASGLAPTSAVPRKITKVNVELALSAN